MDPGQASDECILVFRDGGKASGRLIDFLPDDARLKFRSREAAESSTSPFLARFLQPVALRRQPVRSTIRDAASRQPFALGW